MAGILEFMQGKKTYTIIAVFVLCVVLEKFIGFDIPGFTVGDDWIGEVLAMLGLGTLRAGMAKV